MKANVKTTTQGTIVIRGHAFCYNSLHEHDIRREAEIEKQLEEKYPGAMGLLNMATGFDDAKDGLEVADRCAAATKACVEFFDALFGDGTGAKLLGDSPFYGLSVQVFAEFKAEILRQGILLGQDVGKILNKYEPVGPKGERPG